MRQCGRMHKVSHPVRHVSSFIWCLSKFLKLALHQRGPSVLCGRRMKPPSPTSPATHMVRRLHKMKTDASASRSQASVATAQLLGRVLQIEPTGAQLALGCRNDLLAHDAQHERHRHQLAPAPEREARRCLETAAGDEHSTHGVQPTAWHRQEGSGGGGRSPWSRAVTAVHHTRGARWTPRETCTMRGSCCAMQLAPSRGLSRGCKQGAEMYHVHTQIGRAHV